MTKIENICKDAKLIKHRRGELVICLQNIGEKETLLFCNLEERHERSVSVPYCIATVIHFKSLYPSNYKEPTTFIAYHMLKDCRCRKK